MNNSEKFEFWVPFYVKKVPFLLKIGSPFYNFWVPLRFGNSVIEKLVMSPSLCNWECGSGPVHLSRFSIHFIHIYGRIPSHSLGGGTIPGSESHFFIHLA